MTARSFSDDTEPVIGQRGGIDAAKARGVYKTRKPTVPVEEIRRLRAAGKTPTGLDLGGISSR